jgi:phage gp29-like protein
MGASTDRLGALISPWQKLKAYDTGLTPEVVLGRVIAGSSSSDGQRRLFETMIARDTDLGNAVDQRCLALAGARWRFEPVDNASDADVKRVQDKLPDTAFNQLALEHAAMFRLFGYANLEIEWAPDWSVIALHELPYAAGYAMLGTIYVALATGKWLTTDDPEIADRVLAIRASEHDPSGAARLRRCVGLWITKAYLARDWRKYLERFGDPILKASYDPNAPPPPEGAKTPQQTLLDALEDMRAHGLIVHANNVTIDLMSDPRGAATANFDTLWDRCNAGMTQSIIGQQSTVTKGTGGARASDEVRERTFDSLVEADARVIADAIDSQVVSKVEKIHAGGKKVMHTVFSWERETTPLHRAEIVLTAFKAGIEFDHEAVREELGLEAPSDDQLAADAAKTEQQIALLEAQTKAKAAGQVGQDGAAAAGDGAQGAADTQPPTGLAARLLRAIRSVFTRTPGDVEEYRAGVGTMHKALDGIAAASSGPLREALDGGLMAGLKARLHDGMTLTEVDRALQEALTAENIKPAALVLQKAILAARLNGRLLGMAQAERARKRKAAQSA